MEQKMPNFKVLVDFVTSHLTDVRIFFKINQFNE